MDLTDTITPRSDQMNAEDLLTGPRTFTVAEVRKGSAEQPVDIHLVEFPGRPFRPSKTVRRILVNAWGPEASAYVGRRMTLYRDPSVKFGGMDVGGIRVSHLSHIDKPLSVALTVSRGKRLPYTVQPLPAETADAGRSGEAAPASAPVNRNKAKPGVKHYRDRAAAEADMFRLIREAMPDASKDEVRAFVVGIVGEFETPADLSYDRITDVIAAIKAATGGAS